MRLKVKTAYPVVSVKTNKTCCIKAVISPVILSSKYK
jgi:hypothetical protein